jgi:alkyl hydroperoxide reductase subunit AhpC
MHEHETHEYLLAPQVGEPAPIFDEMATYHKGEFKTASLRDYAGKWIVLFFYPRDFTFICPTEIEEFGKMYPEFQNLGCEILAASTDSKEVHKAWFETDARLKAVSYPIIADTTHELADMYNVLDNDGAAQRGTFVIDPDGILRFILVSADSVGRNIQEMLRVVEALQTGEKCPANWQKGEETLHLPA